MDTDLFAIRDRAIAVLLEIAENDTHPIEDRGFASDVVLRDILEHRRADIEDRTEQLQRHFDEMERIADTLRERLDERDEAKA